MKVVYLIFRYIGYITCSVCLGWLSSLGGEEKDYIVKISMTFIPVLLTLIALTTTLTGLLLNELYKFKSKLNDQNVDINNVVDGLKRNVIIQIAIVVIIFIFLCIKESIIIYNPALKDYIAIIQNSIIVFAFIYFVLVITDTAMGLYDLIKTNNS